MARRWVRVVGDGLACQGACQIFSIIFWPDSDADYVDVYDGVDAISGKKFCRIETSMSITWTHGFPQGVLFDVGIYLDGYDSAVETTVCFEPLE